MDRGKKRYMLLYFQVLSIQFFDNVLSCPASIPTISYVPICPKNQEEWEKAAQLKNCESIAAIQNCTKERSKFQYHCLINQSKNATLEVCAPIFYLQGYCAEYNIQIKQVAEIYDKGFECLKFPDRHKCPPRYPSNEAYKYQRCYEYKNKTSKLIETLHTKKLSSKDNSMIALYFIIIVSLLFGLIASVFVMLRKGVFERFFFKGCEKSNEQSNMDLEQNKNEEKEDEKEENEEGGEGNEETKLLSAEKNKAGIENGKHEGRKPVTAEEKMNTEKAKNEEKKFPTAEEKNDTDVGIEKVKHEGKKPITAEEKRNTGEKQGVKSKIAPQPPTVQSNNTEKEESCQMDGAVANKDPLTQTAKKKKPAPRPPNVIISGS